MKVTIGNEEISGLGIRDVNYSEPNTPQLDLEWPPPEEWQKWKP